MKTPAPAEAKKKESPAKRRKLKQEKVKLAVDLIGAGNYKGEVKKALREKFGLQFRKAEDIITEAKKVLLDQTDRPAEEHISEAAAFYASIIRDPSVEMRERIRARENLDKLYGLQGLNLDSARGNEERRKLVADVTMNVLGFLAGLSEITKKIIVDKQDEIATFIDSKYGEAAQLPNKYPESKQNYN